MKPACIVLKARGQSMFPLVPDGSILFFEPDGPIAVGDVILTQDGDRQLAHRVVLLHGDTVTTWGDWNRVPDPPVARTRIVGRCVQVRRKGIDISMDLPCVRVVGRLLARLLPAAKSILHRQG